MREFVEVRGRRAVPLERTRTLLKAQTPEPAKAEREPWEELLYRLTGVDPSRCPSCGEGTLHRHHELPKAEFAPSRGPP